jgi:hypothetical protein
MKHAAIGLGVVIGAGFLAVAWIITSGMDNHRVWVDQCAQRHGVDVQGFCISEDVVIKIPHSREDE